MSHQPRLHRERAERPSRCREGALGVIRQLRLTAPTGVRQQTRRSRRRRQPTRRSPAPAWWKTVLRDAGRRRHRVELVGDGRHERVQDREVAWQHRVDAGQGPGHVAERRFRPRRRRTPHRRGPLPPGSDRRRPRGSGPGSPTASPRSAPRRSRDSTARCTASATSFADGVGEPDLRVIALGALGGAALSPAEPETRTPFAA